MGGRSPARHLRRHGGHERGQRRPARAHPHRAAGPGGRAAGGRRHRAVDLGRRPGRLGRPREPHPLGDGDPPGLPTAHGAPHGRARSAAGCRRPGGDAGGPPRGDAGGDAPDVPADGAVDDGRLDGRAPRPAQRWGSTTSRSPVRRRAPTPTSSCWSSRTSTSSPRGGAFLPTTCGCGSASTRSPTTPCSPSRSVRAATRRPARPSRVGLPQRPLGPRGPDRRDRPQRSRRHGRPPGGAGLARGRARGHHLARAGRAAPRAGRDRGRRRGRGRPRGRRRGQPSSSPAAPCSARRCAAAGSRPREADRFVERLLGLELAQATYDRGAAFVAGVLERAGDDGLRRLWTDPDHLPTPAEVDAPGLWLARIDL